MKRFVLKLLLLLLLGAIINVAVAWGIAWRQDFKDAATHKGVLRLESDAGWVVDVRCVTGACQVTRHWHKLRQRSWSSPDYLKRRDSIFREGNASIIPYWSATVQSDQKEQATPYYNVEDARGWPFLCMRCEISVGGLALKDTPANQRPPNAFVDKGDSVRGGMYLAGGGVAGRLGEIKTLPFRPIWPGFAINTMFYTAILGSLFVAPLALLRWRRLKRGKCPKCAYPNGTSDTCTECGKPVKRKIIAQKAGAA